MELRDHEKKLLEAISCSLQGKTVEWNSVSQNTLEPLFALSVRHKVLPLVYEAVNGCPAVSCLPQMDLYKRQATAHVVRQTQRSLASLAVYSHLRSAGLHPLILKGAVCRRIYPMPDHRISGDEDFYIREEELEPCCRELSGIGLISEHDTGESWVDAGRTVHIELHKELFPTKLLGHSLRQMFDEGFLQTETYETESGQWIESFDPHLHFLYLILHAYKHFLHSGFGIRQICDIGLWAREYRDRIDWERLLRECETVRAVEFTASVLRIARDMLMIGLELPDEWEKTEADPLPLVLDVLDAGIYGSASAARLHSALALQEQKGNPIRVLFPDLEYMSGKYPKWKDKKYLLPVMWARRLGEYGFQVLKRQEAPLESVSIAKQRQELLRYYHIIP